MTTTNSWLTQLINEFYLALRRRDFARAGTVIDQLKSGKKTDADELSWATYFCGILAEEQHRDWSTAEALYRKSVGLSSDEILLAHVFLSLGIAYERQGLWIDSVQACEKSVELWHRIGDRVKRAIVQRQLAMTLRHGYELGDLGPDALQRSKKLVELALQTFVDYDESKSVSVLYKPDINFNIGITWYELGQLHLVYGEWQQAIDCLQQLLNMCEERDDRYHAAYALLRMADAYQMLESARWPQAVELYQNALSRFQDFDDIYQQFLAHAGLGTALERINDIESATNHYDQALNKVEQVRSQVSTEAARVAFLSTLIYIYDRAVLAQIRANQVERAFQYSELVRSRTFIESLSDDAKADEQFPSKTMSLEELQTLLPPDAVLLEYFTTGLLNLQGRRTTEEQAAKNVLYPPPKILLFVITRASISARELDLSPNLLIPGNLDKPVEDYFLGEPIRRYLYQTLLLPVKDILDPMRRYYIVPHGPLHYVPFHALTAPDGETLLREDGPEFVYGPSASILFRDYQAANAAPHSCLAVGYNGSGETKLHFAEDEAHFIGKISRGVAVTGSMPKKHLLFQRASNFNVLHFSCHGTFNPESPLESALYISEDETLTGREIIENLKLNCRLVILSACESALSTVKRGDELYGLVRAFMYAGAPAIIATQWRVDERTTLILADKFYREVQNGLGYPAALKSAQVYLKNLAHPEALAILMRLIDQSVEFNREGVKRAALLSADQQARGYLTMLKSKRATASTPLVSENNPYPKPFADPKYWAPFVFIGGCRDSLYGS